MVLFGNGWVGFLGNNGDLVVIYPEMCIFSSYILLLGVMGVLVMLD